MTARVAEGYRDAIKALADAYTRLLLIESYLEIGDPHSVRSAIQAWREELHKEAALAAQERKP